VGEKQRGRVGGVSEEVLHCAIAKLITIDIANKNKISQTLPIHPTMYPNSGVLLVLMSEEIHHLIEK
jgi:hypothetical protein